MKTDRDLNYRLYIQRSDGFTRSPFENELSFYRTIQAGDMEGVKKRFETVRKNFFERQGNSFRRSCPKYDVSFCDGCSTCVPFLR